MAAQISRVPNTVGSKVGWADKCTSWIQEFEKDVFFTSGIAWSRGLLLI